MLRMRLARKGSRNRPFYRIVVADVRSPRDGRYIEKIGHYDPLIAADSPRKEERLRLNRDRALYWLSHGVQPSDRVRRLLAIAGVLEPPAIPQQTKKPLPGKKALERQAAA